MARTLLSDSEAVAVTFATSEVEKVQSYLDWRASLWLLRQVRNWCDSSRENSQGRLIPRGAQNIPSKSRVLQAGTIPFSLPWQKGVSTLHCKGAGGSPLPIFLVSDQTPSILVHSLIIA